MRHLGLIAATLTVLSLLLPVHAAAQVWQAAWFERDESNALIPLDPENPADAVMAEAMGVMFSRGIGTTQATQVCPGVYIGVMHGAFREGDFSSGKWAQRRVRVKPYPFGGKENSLYAEQFHSPRYPTDDARIWGDLATDYLLVRVEQPKTDAVLPVVLASTQDLLDYHFRGGKIRLYRSDTMYSRWKTYSNGEYAPDLGSATFNKFVDFRRIYRAPLKVEGRCRPTRFRETGRTSHDCPTENHVSGAPMIVTDPSGNPFLVGIHTNGGSEYKDRSHPEFRLLNGMVNSEAFCPMYEDVCGRPCLPFSTVYTHAR